MSDHSQLLPFLGIFLVFGLLYVVAKAVVAYHQLKKRRSPFVGNFLRSPGESIRWQLEDVSENVCVYISYAFLLPLIFYSGILTLVHSGGEALPLSWIWISIFVVAGFEAYFICRLVLLINRRRTLRLGYEGELAEGQELNQLLRDGYEVYHDFPAEKFNIDHIVIGPSGVYAVETKGRRKPTTGDGKSDAKVVYDGQKLQFPDWVETKPLEQARQNAQWLSRWLSSAVGDTVHVQPVIALPGWYVERTSPNGFPVINPKNFRSILRSSKSKPLDKGMITRIVHQIDQRCRDVHPRASEGLGGKPGLPDKDNA